MLKSNPTHQLKRRVLLTAVRIGVLGAVLLAMLGISTSGKAAGATDSWAPPANLSHSGSATNPILVKDSAGTLHLIWEDKFLGYVSSGQKDGQWTAPVPVQFPWSPPSQTKFSLDAPVPVLVADSKGHIHAFWIDSKNRLLYSNVTAADFNNSNQWKGMAVLSDSAVNMTAVVDQQDQIHLAFIVPAETTQHKAGIYYLRSSNSGVDWSKPFPLYLSTYLQNATKDQANIAFSSGSSGGTSTLYLAWDNRPLKRVFFARSADSGKTWDAPQEIDGPASASGELLPYDISIGAAGSSAVLVWQIGQPGGSCKQVSQASSDSGKTWTAHQELMSNSGVCPSANQFITLGDQSLMLASTAQNQVNFLDWNGKQWSEPQIQGSLFSFINPDTFTAVKLGCQQFILGGPNQLIAVGCEANGFGDIWFTARPLDSLAGWFTPKSGWSTPIQVLENQYPMTDMNVVPEGEGAVHAMWVQPDPSSLQTSSVFYSHLSEGVWSTPTVVLRSPAGNSYDLSVTLGLQNRLYAAWSGGPSGRIYVSWADASRAMDSTEWTPPVPVPTQQPAGSSPEISVDAAGTIFIAYAIPLNEDRGIYLSLSSDAGLSWSQPERVFDAVSAGWSQVDLPHLSMSPGGSLTMTWTQLTLPGGGGPIAVYEASSTDHGKSWSSANKIVDGNVVWSKIIAQDDQNLYLTWIEKSRDLYTLRGKASTDGGLNWGQPETISNSKKYLGPVAFLQDAAAQLHIIQVSDQGAGTPILEHWTLDANTWNKRDQLPLPDGTSIQGASLAASMTSNGSLYALIPLQTLDSVGLQESYPLDFSSLALQIPNQKPASIPQKIVQPLTVSSSTPVAATLVPTPEVAPTLAPLPNTAGSNGSLLDSSSGGIVIGSLFATLVVSIGLGIVLVMKKSHPG